MSPGPTVVLLDANVLYSRALRDWICLSALRCADNMFRIRWSEDILSEWMYNYRRKNPHLSDQSVGGMRRRLEAAFPSAMVTGYAVDPQTSAVKDKNDAHVHAAALAAGVDIVVSANVKDFSEDPDDLDYEVWTPDDFLCLVDDSSPSAVQKVLSEQLEYWRAKRPGSVPDLPLALEDANAAQFADRIRCHLKHFALNGLY
jgi:predicted nucleic acid-binding protein